MSDQIRQNGRISPSSRSDDQARTRGSQLHEDIGTSENLESGAESNPSVVDIGTRLHLEGRRQANNLLKLQQEYEDKEYERTQASRFKNTAKMPISSSKKEDLFRSDESNTEEGGMLSLDFHERQKIHLRKIKLKHAQQLQKRDDEAKGWFRPKTLPKSEELLLERHPDRVFESPDDRIERLTQHHLMVRILDEFPLDVMT